MNVSRRVIVLGRGSLAETVHKVLSGFCPVCSFTYGLGDTAPTRASQCCACGTSFRSVLQASPLAIALIPPAQNPSSVASTLHQLRNRCWEGFFYALACSRAQAEMVRDFPMFLVDNKPVTFAELQGGEVWHLPWNIAAIINRLAEMPAFTIESDWIVYKQSCALYELQNSYHELRLKAGKDDSKSHSDLCLDLIRKLGRLDLILHLRDPHQHIQLAQRQIVRMQNFPFDTKYQQNELVEFVRILLEWSVIGAADSG